MKQRFSKHLSGVAVVLMGSLAIAVASPKEVLPQAPAALVKSYRDALSKVPVGSLVAKATSLVLNSKGANRATDAEAVVLAVHAVSPGSLLFVVGAICEADPSLAPVVVAAAVKAEPRLKSVIVQVATDAAPDQKASIAQAAVSGQSGVGSGTLASAAPVRAKASSPITGPPYTTFPGSPTLATTIPETRPRQRYPMP